MSEAAVRARSAQRRWARTGSSHDRLIALLRIVLPAAILMLVLLLAIVPVVGERNISFMLSKDHVAVAHERMRATDAVYRGQDAKGQPFSLRAGSAVQATSAVPIVRLADLTGSIRLPDGPATIAAATGRYDMDTEQVNVDGPVRFRGADGYRLDTRDVTVDMKTRQVRSGGAADGAMNLGTFRADRLNADLADKTVVLTGRVHLRIVQAGGRGAR